MRKTVNRRTYLAAIGGLTTAAGGFLAGCSGSQPGGSNTSGGGNSGGSGKSGNSGNGGGSGGGGSNAKTATESAPAGNTQTNQGSADTGASTEGNAAPSTTQAGGASGSGSASASSALAVKDTQLVQGDLGEVLTASLTHTGKQRLSYVEATATFTDDSGAVLGTNFTNLIGLSPGETWDVYIPYLGTSGTPTDGKVRVTAADPGTLPQSPEGVTILDSHLQKPTDQFSPPKVVGQAKNGSGGRLDYLEAAATFYGENNHVLSSGFTNVTGLAAGQTWRFAIPFTSYNPDAEVADYKLYLKTSPFA